MKLDHLLPRVGREPAKNPFYGRDIFEFSSTSCAVWQGEQLLWPAGFIAAKRVCHVLDQVLGDQRQGLVMNDGAKNIVESLRRLGLRGLVDVVAQVVAATTFRSSSRARSAATRARSAASRDVTRRRAS